MSKKAYIDAKLLQAVFDAVTKIEDGFINYFFVPFRVVCFVLMLVPMMVISFNVKEV
jgi:hypothetical protein